MESETIPYVFSNRKRAFDGLVAGGLLPITTLAEFGTAMLLRRDLDAGSAYFKQERAGGINIIKLRTMRLLDEGEEIGSVHAGMPAHGPRVVSERAGRIRKTRLDELPQIRQVVRSMLKPPHQRLSLVGVRPLVEGHADEYYQEVKKTDPVLAERWRYLWIPYAPKGVTGPASSHYIGRTRNDEIDPLKWIHLEDDYCLGGSVTEDISIIGRTVSAMGSAMLSGALDRNQVLE